jgi:hypothetical protein
MTINPNKAGFALAALRCCGTGFIASGDGLTRTA